MDMEACAAGPARAPTCASTSPWPRSRSPSTRRGSPTGPFQLLGYRVRCGTRVPGIPLAATATSTSAAAEVQEARYFKVQDGELYPSARATPPSEGADIDAVEILHLK